MFGFYETVVEYYTGRDASLLTEDQLVIKVAHILKVRELEESSALAKHLKLFTR